MTKIIRCECKHEFQDKVYGHGNRLHNQKGSDNGWRCTVCSAMKAGNSSSYAKKK